MKPVLVACEYSGTVRDALRRRGIEAVSCDLLDTDVPGPHYKGDLFDIIGDGWSLMIAHPPCTHLCVSGARWWPAKIADGRQAGALDFVRRLMAADIPRIAIENPIGRISTEIRKPDQIIQPWMFGHGETKATCLWLKNLPPLTPTEVVSGRDGFCHKLPPSKDRWKIRSKTYLGIAEAMAAQWGDILKREG